MKIGFKKNIPWQIKLALKLFFSFLNISRFLEKHRIFAHGEENNPEKALKFFENHFIPSKKRAGLANGFTALELGPGYSPHSPLLVEAFGGKFTYLIDKDRFAKEDARWFSAMAEFLKKKGFPRTEKKPNYQYLTQGLKSLKKIPDQSVDFVFSQVVLEHIKKDEFLPLLRELRRITKDSGVHSHTVDLKDHLGTGLNHLKFSKRIWQSRIFQNSSFYTNRLRFSEMLDCFEKAGFRYEILKTIKSEKPLLERKFLAKEFSRLSEEDILIEGFHILLFPLN